MSDSYTNTNMRAESLNQAAAHDTGLYDPNVHDNQIVAMFENDAKARAARDALVASGVPEGAIHLSDKGQGVADVSTAEDGGGLWGAIRSLFMPDEDAHGYAEGVRRGHAVLVVQPTAEMDRHQVITVIESNNPVDFDAKLEEWRQAGYNYADPGAGAASTATGVAADTNEMRSVDTTAAGTFRNAPSGSSSENDYMSGDHTDDMPGGDKMPQGSRSDVAGTRASPAQAEMSEGGRSYTGRREAIQGTGRVRSYVVERPMG